MGEPTLPDIRVGAGDLGPVPIIPIIYILTGAYLAWFGVKYFRSDVTWPSDPVKAVLQGKPIPASGAATTSAQILAEAGATTGSTGSAPVPPGASGDAAQAQNIAKMLTVKYGWSPGQDNAQWNALVDLWDRESSWKWNATNPSSGAYGIPQSLPASKMASAGPDWMTNPATQIRWGLSYIKSRYGSPAVAWQHEQTHSWY